MRDIHDELDHGLLILDSRTMRPLHFNSVAAQILGRDEVSLRQESFLTLVVPEERQKVGDRFRRLLAGEPVPGRIETAVLVEDGRRVDLELAARILGDVDGDQILLVFRDVTEAKRRESVQVKRLQQLQSLAEASVAIGPSLSAQEVLELLMERARATFEVHLAVATLTVDGGLAQAVRATSCSERYAPSRDDALQMGAPIFETKLRRQNRPVRFSREELEADPDWRRQWSGNRPVPSEWLVAPMIGRSGRCLGLVQIADKFHGEFTEHDAALFFQLAQTAAVGVEIARLFHSAQEADLWLRQHLEFSGAVTSSLGEGVYAINRAGRFTFVNPAAEAMMGWPQVELLGRRASELVHSQTPDGHPILPEQCPLLGVIHGKPPVQGQTVIFDRKDGGKLAALCSSAPILVDGEVTGAVMAFQDIGEMKQTQAALADEKDRLAVTLNSIADGVVATDELGHVVLFNRVAEELAGRRPEDIVGRPVGEVFQFLDERSQQPVANPVEEALQGGSIVGQQYHRLRIPGDGVERIVSVSAAPIRDHDGRLRGGVLVLQDITLRRKMEEEIGKASKLESIGLLAGGIAHDFNNLLTAIMANVSIAKLLTVPNTKTHQRLLEVEKASMRAKDLTQQLLTFAKGGAPVKRPTSIRDLLSDTSDFARSGSSARLELSLPEELWPVEADEGQISQVIHNLVINAQQAMRHGGDIRISAENVMLGAAEIPSVEPGPYVKISVTDEGVGIPEEHLARVFEPYFTTKKTGSGLGLATAYSIVRKHGGALRVDSRPGHGTTVSFYLPASDRPLPEKPLLLAELSPHGRGRVLVLDDEPLVREVALELLGHLGYQVDVAENGVDAVSRYRTAHKEGDPYDVVILDLTLPGGMSGTETMQLLKEYDPDVKAIVSSGYSNDPVMSNYTRYGFKGVAAKPYNIEELGGVVHRVIRGLPD